MRRIIMEKQNRNRPHKYLDFGYRDRADYTDYAVDTNDYSTAFMQGGRSGGSQERDEMYDIVKEAVQARDFCSISWIQREFGFGFPRSGRIFAQLKQDGIVANEPDSPSSNKGSRVLIKSSNVINMDEHPNNEGLSPIKTLDDDDSFDDMKGGTY